MTKSKLVRVAAIERRILLIRGEKVIVDADLAAFYGVATKRLNEQVKRNRDRFPDDFMFQLSDAEKSEVVANCDHLRKLKFAKSAPYAFTEHGALMAASVLNSKRAVELGVFIVRAFVQLRRMTSEQAVLAQRLDEIERRLTDHDAQIGSVALLCHLQSAVRSDPKLGTCTNDPDFLP